MMNERIDKVLYICCIAIILATTSVNAQVAVVSDEDGWSYVRKSRSPNAAVIHKIDTETVFWYNYTNFKDSSRWIEVYIPKNKYSLGIDPPNIITGYIHSSRLMPLEQMDACNAGELEFAYHLGGFKRKGRNITLYDDRWVIEVDGRRPWGIDGTYPRIEVDSISIKLAGRSIDVHEILYSDIFEVSNQFQIYKRNDTYFVYQFNSDGAGGYEVVWVIDKEGLRQRLTGRVL